MRERQIVKSAAVAASIADSSVDSIAIVFRRVSVSASTVATEVSPPVPNTRIGIRLLADRWLPWIAALCALLAAVHAIEPLPVGVFYDDAQYLVLAKSLATGHGYRFLNLPGAPHGTHFPPGYPAFLAMLWLIAPAFPENVALFKFANAVLVALVALFAYRFANRELGIPRLLALAAAVAGTATIPTLVLSSALMSEPLFLALLLPLLAWAERLTQSPTTESPPRPLVSALLLGAATGALALVRTHGIAVSGAVVVAYLSRGRRRDAAFAALGAAALLLPWSLWVAVHNEQLPRLLHGAYGSYTGWLASGVRSEGWHLFAVTIPDNVATIWMTVVRSLVPAGNSALDIAVGGLFLIFTAIAADRCWHRARVAILFVAGYLAIVCVWPFSPLRFVWGIWPLAMVIPAAGMAAAWNYDFVKRVGSARVALVAASGALAIGVITFNLRGYANAWWSSNARYHARRVLAESEWVSRSTAASDLVGADTEAALYLYTGRLTVPLTSFTASEYVRERTVDEEAAVVAQVIDLYRPRFMLATSPKLSDALARVAKSRSAVLTRVDSLPRGAVYRSRRCTMLASGMGPQNCE